jgi:hypothetical protein
MSSDKPKHETNNQFEFLFGPPALIQGEDEERYLRLRAAVVDEMKPKTVFDYINAKDQVDKLWEEQRYKRAADALIDGGMVKALEYYLHEVCEVDLAEDLSHKYFNGDAKGRKEVMSELAQHGITTAQLQAKATQLEGGGLALFDRLVSTRESGRRLLRKETERNNRRGGDRDETTE